MNIAIIGAGNVGGALGTQLSKKGHSIIFGVPNKDDEKFASLKSNPNTEFNSPAAAAKGAEVILLATPWGVTEQAIKDCGDVSGKILVDCTNPFNAEFTGLEIGHTTSGAETIASWALGAKVVKCFNQTGFGNMENPDYGDIRVLMFAAGDDEAAVKIAADLARDVGYDAVELIGLYFARQLEQMAWLWIDMAHKQGMGLDFAFALLRR